MSSGEPGGPRPSPSRGLGKKHCFARASPCGVTMGLVYPHTPAVPRSARGFWYSYRHDVLFLCWFGSATCVVHESAANQRRLPYWQTSGLHSRGPGYTAVLNQHFHMPKPLGSCPIGLPTYVRVSRTCTLPVTEGSSTASRGRDRDPVAPRFYSFPPVICTVDIAS